MDGWITVPARHTGHHLMWLVGTQSSADLIISLSILHRHCFALLSLPPSHSLRPPLSILCLSFCFFLSFFLLLLLFLLVRFFVIGVVLVAVCTLSLPGDMFIGVFRDLPDLAPPQF